VIALVDYGMGNVRSVLNAFESIGTEARLVSDPADVVAAEKVVVPGVGAFGDAMAAPPPAAGRCSASASACSCSPRARRSSASTRGST
jgi:imidazoleglycerol phosphate synthase glutamine amidotransferase subunit HisH